jgi:hypothetical protein
LAQVVGWRSPFPDIAVSGALVASLVGIFSYVVVMTRRRAAGSALAPVPSDLA